jgi:hypothetical protein
MYALIDVEGPPVDSIGGDLRRSGPETRVTALAHIMRPLMGPVRNGIRIPASTTTSPT